MPTPASINTVCNEKNRFFSTDIAAAYPAEAKVKSWVRSYKLDDRKLVVADNYTLNEVLAPNQVNFLTWGNVTFPSPGKVRIEVRGQKVELDYPAHFLFFCFQCDPVNLLTPYIRQARII